MLEKVKEMIYEACVKKSFLREDFYVILKERKHKRRRIMK